MNNGIMRATIDTIKSLRLDIVEAPAKVKSGDRTLIKVDIFNESPEVVRWKDNESVTVSYRWFDPVTGQALVMDGPRTYIRNDVEASQPQRLTMEVAVPELHGTALLRVSCVYEGHFWFYEAGLPGWAECCLPIVDPLAWMSGRERSLATRALSGGLVVAELRRRLAEGSWGEPAPASGAVAQAPEPVAEIEQVRGPAMFEFEPAPVERIVTPEPPLAEMAWPSVTWPDEPQAHSAGGVSTSARDWLQRPVRTFRSELDGALARSPMARQVQQGLHLWRSLFRRIGIAIRATRQTQQILVSMAADQQRRDAWHAEQFHRHVALVRDELLAAIGQATQSADSALSAVQASARQTVDQLLVIQAEQSGQLKALDDTVRRVQLGQIRTADALQRLGEDNRRQLTSGFDSVQAGHAELGQLLKTELGMAQAEAGARMEELGGTLVHLLQTVRTEVVEMLRMTGDAQEALNGEVDGRLNQTVQALNARFDHLLEQVATDVDRIRLEVHGDLAATTANVSEWGRALAGMQGCLETNFGYVFPKLDLLLHRQVVPLPGVGLVVCRNSAGLFAIPEGDLDTVSYYAAGDLPEPGSLALVERLLAPGDVFVDVGANVGLFSVVAGRRVGPGGAVLAFEPVPDTMNALRSTIRLNGLDRVVELYQAAAGSQAGTAPIHIGVACGYSSLLPLNQARGTIDVAVVSLDGVIGDRPVKLVKIDVEGWELEVIKGMRQVLKANPEADLLLEFGPSHIVRANSDVATWLQAINSLDRTVFEIDERTGRVAPLRRSGFERIESINLLLSRKSVDELNAD